MGVKIFQVLCTTFTLLLSVSTGGPSESSCGGLITLNGTSVDLRYKIPVTDGTTEAVEDSSTCVWVIWTKIGNSIGFNLTRLDLDTHNRPPGSSVKGVLSIQKGIQSHQNYTVPILIDGENIGQEIIVNETWTLLVFRHFSSDARITGKGFRVSIWSVQNTKQFKNDSIGVHTEFLGGRNAMSKDSRFLRPESFGQPGVFIINSRHGQTLQVNTWTLLMDEEEFANFYRFSKDQNKFVFVTTLIYMLKSKTYYGTLQGDQDQPILFYFHTTGKAPVNGTGDKGKLNLSYCYTDLTNNTATTTKEQIISESTTASTLLGQSVVSGVKKQDNDKVNGLSEELIIFLCLCLLGLVFVIIFVSVRIGRCSRNLTGRRFWSSSIIFTKFSNERVDKIALTEPQDIHVI